MRVGFGLATAGEYEHSHAVALMQGRRARRQRAARIH